jgi:hypothetical protein
MNGIQSQEQQSAWSMGESLAVIVVLCSTSSMGC